MLVVINFSSTQTSICYIVQGIVHSVLCNSSVKTSFQLANIGVVGSKITCYKYCTLTQKLSLLWGPESFIRFQAFQFTASFCIIQA